MTAGRVGQAAFFVPYNLGSEEGAVKHWLLLDRIQRGFSIGLAPHVKAFLASVPNETLSSDCDSFDSGTSSMIEASLWLWWVIG